MQLAGLSLILAGILTAVGQFLLAHGAPPPADTFTGPALAYDLAAIMGLGGLATLLIGPRHTPVDDEPESPDLRLVG
jgi:hypothetical protein